MGRRKKWLTKAKRVGQFIKNNTKELFQLVFMIILAHVAHGENMFWAEVIYLVFTGMFFNELLRKDKKEK